MHTYTQTHKHILIHTYIHSTYTYTQSHGVVSTTFKWWEARRTSLLFPISLLEAGSIQGQEEGCLSLHSHMAKFQNTKQNKNDLSKTSL